LLDQPVVAVAEIEVARQAVAENPGMPPAVAEAARTEIIDGQLKLAVGIANRIPRILADRFRTGGWPSVVRLGSKR